MDRPADRPQKPKSYYHFKCKAVPSPPGTKSMGRLPRGLESDPVLWARGWALAGMIAALVIGLFAGRFLLP
jgi:hypothetical protein